jgi:phosphatidylserine/phosphatidylglycerophosphate/cardiolipin synthase-like enzyme
MYRTSLRPVLWLVAMLLVAEVIYYRQHGHLWPQAEPPLIQGATESGAAVNEDHFSPAEDLESLDAAQIDHARRTLDVAMFAFTDRYLADALVRAAHRGVKVRIYRDHGQYEDEERGTGRREAEPTTQRFAGEPNIQVRVKGTHELMHLKAYCVDGALLRDGSANWSPSGLKRQDNNAHFTSEPEQVRLFERDFEDMWSRENQVVQ